MKTYVKILLLNFFLISTVFGQTLKEAYDKTNEFRAKGDYHTAIEWAEKALALAGNDFGRQNETYAAFLNHLAYLDHLIGRYDHAEPLYKQALGIQKKTLGEDHPFYATSLDNLAVLYKSMGRYEQAEPSFARANSGLITILGALIIFFSWVVNNPLKTSYSNLSSAIKSGRI